MHWTHLFSAVTVVGHMLYKIVNIRQNPILAPLQMDFNQKEDYKI